MYMKVFPHGQGDGEGPTRYLVRPDYPGRDESPPEVLRGDTELTHALIDSLDTKWKFTAGVLSWHPDDRVTPEQERRVMDDFEKVAFAGLEPDQRNILWVRHLHADHHELHFVIPRVELGSGKAFNPCPPGWQKHFDVFRDLHNHREGWARPDDPARARLHTPEHADLHKARLIRWGKAPNFGVQQDDRTEAKEAIHAYLKDLLEQGRVKNRADVLMALQEAGLEINRAGKDYITVKDSENGEKLRLKGGIYAEYWNFNHIISRAAEGQDRAGTAGDGESDPTTVQRLERELAAVVEKRAQTTEAAILKEIMNMEKNITSRCQSLGSMFSKKYLYSILLSAGILSLTVLTCWGLITLYQYRITDLRREMVGLTGERDALEAKNTALWNTFKGLEPYQVEGKHYLLTPKGLIIRSAGTVGQREAWEVVRK